MDNSQVLIFFDLSAFLLMMILAYLSKRLGDALKIRPYYKLLYATAFMIICALAADFAVSTSGIAPVFAISYSLRFVAGAVAFLICLRYWHWLFAEYFKHM